MTQPNPLQLATKALNMGRQAEGRDSMMFNKLALICMGVTAAAAATQVMTPVLKELLAALNRKYQTQERRCQRR